MDSDALSSGDSFRLDDESGSIPHGSEGRAHRLRDRRTQHNGLQRTDCKRIDVDFPTIGRTSHCRTIPPGHHGTLRLRVTAMLPVPC